MVFVPNGSTRESLKPLAVKRFRLHCIIVVTGISHPDKFLTAALYDTYMIAKNYVFQCNTTIAVLVDNKMCYSISLALKEIHAFR